MTNKKNWNKLKTHLQMMTITYEHLLSDATIDAEKKKDIAARQETLDAVLENMYVIENRDNQQMQTQNEETNE